MGKHLGLGLTYNTSPVPGALGWVSTLGVASLALFGPSSASPSNTAQQDGHASGRWATSMLPAAFLHRCLALSIGLTCTRLDHHPSRSFLCCGCNDQSEPPPQDPNREQNTFRSSDPLDDEGRLAQHYHCLGGIGNGPNQRQPLAAVVKSLLEGKRCPGWTCGREGGGNGWWINDLSCLKLAWYISQHKPKRQTTMERPFGPLTPEEGMLLEASS